MINVSFDIRRALAFMVF